MARDKSRVERRNLDITTEYQQLRAKNPHWKTYYIFEQLATKFYLSAATIENIIIKTKKS